MVIKKILEADGKCYAWRGRDFHTNFGVIKESALKKANGKVKTNIGKEFIARAPDFFDFVKFMKRGPQMPLHKDIAIILYYLGINKNSVVVDAGTGSGLLAISLARIAKRVYSYEIKKEAWGIAKKNAADFGIKNLVLKNRDIAKRIDEKNVDAITLDLPEPWKVLDAAKKSLRSGGRLMAYLPSIVQVIQLVKKAEKAGFSVLKTIEVLERQWVVEGKKVRPRHDMYGHTAFLVFLRKQ